VGIKKPDRQPDLLGDDSHGFCQVRVVGDDHSYLKPFPVGVSQEMGRGFTSEPFSSVLSTQTFCGGSTFVRYIGTEWVVNWPYLI
jgi:hypothetical protein